MTQDVHDISERGKGIVAIRESSPEQELRGLIVRAPWVDYLLDGTKVWEIRGSATRIRGRIALIRGGSGLVVGTINLVDCHPLTRDEYLNGEAYHRVPISQIEMPYRHPYAWVMSDPDPFKKPVRYQHPRGAVIWVRLGALSSKPRGLE